MKKIVLLNKAIHTDKYVLVDNSDFEYLNKYRWYFTHCNLAHGNGYAVRHEGRKSIYMHREILKPVKGLVTDHINGNGLDNRRSNLRACTIAQNAHNRNKRSNSALKYKGVSKNVDNNNQWSGKYGARILINGKQRFLGTFNTQIGARRAYLKAAKQFHGEMAK